jgi:hypothetical protein
VREEAISSDSGRHSVRAESGKDISNANPSLVAGAAGGGFAGCSETCPATAAFVAVPIGSSVIAGASQARRAGPELTFDACDRISVSGMSQPIVIMGISPGKARASQGSQETGAQANGTLPVTLITLYIASI